MSTAGFRLENAGLIQCVMMLWDDKMNTADMATRLHRPESEVATALHIGREQRRAA